MHRSNTASQIFDNCGSRPAPCSAWMRVRTKSTASWLLKTSQTPSQATMKNSSFGSSLCFEHVGFRRDDLRLPVLNCETACT